MKSLTIISMLLDYPDDALWEIKDQVIEEIENSSDFTITQKMQLTTFAQTYLNMPLMDAQELYCSTFDVGNTTSLLLFEHIHGDSRERGQAMVDLLAQYEQAGLTITEKQLPDYLPLFLEFIAHQPKETSLFWLDQIAMILRLLALRLIKRESQYHVLFDVLFALSGHQADDSLLQHKVSNEQADNTPQAMDKIWQEEQVLFNAGSACDTSVNRPMPTQSQAPTYFVDVGEDKRSQV